VCILLADSLLTPRLHQNWDLPDPVVISAEEELEADPEVTAHQKEFIEKVRSSCRMSVLSVYPSTSDRWTHLIRTSTIGCIPPLYGHLN